MLRRYTTKPRTAAIDALAWGVFHAATGYLAHRLGDERLGREGPVLRLRDRERGGRWYRDRLQIQRWKDRLPEAGGLFEGGVSKRALPAPDDAGLELFVRETRRAELTHWWAMACGPVFAGWNPPHATALLVSYGVGVNAPFIAVQRYNRARAVAILERRARRARGATGATGAPGFRSARAARACCQDDLMRRAVGPLLALTVALVLADSAVVTLALPDILRELDTSVGQVAWVLICFNLVLGLAAVPAAWGLARLRPAVPTAVGIALFAGASAWCAVAGSIDVLIAARCLQSVGGALAVVGSLELLVAEHGERRGVGVWATAGVVGTAAGPFAGGLLTELISWQAIFVVQVPIAAFAVPAALAARARPVTAGGVVPGGGPTGDPAGATVPAGGTLSAGGAVPGRRGPDVRAHLTLALLSAALTAALFLLVLLLVEGWGRSPGVAALTVSVVPVAALAAGPLARALRPSERVEVGVGCFLVAGGLLALAIPPSAHLGWTVAPQALVGLGLGLTVDRLTARAVQLRHPRVEHAGWTIGARHVGVVVGLAILTPVFTADLQDAQVPAQEAITALVLDAPLQPEDKIAVAQALGSALTGQRGQVPDLGPAFDTVEVAPAEQSAVDRLERDLDDQLERAATRAFRDSFLLGAGFAVLALLVVLAPHRRRRVAA